MRHEIPMKKQNTFIVTAAVTATVIAAFWQSLATPGYTGNASNWSRDMTPYFAFNHQLHTTILWICVAIASIIFSAMFLAIVVHRKSGDFTASRYSHSTGKEIIWTIIPILILVVTAVPATNILVNREVAPETEMTANNPELQWHMKTNFEQLERPAILPGSEYRKWALLRNNFLIDEQVEIGHLWRREELMGMSEDGYTARCAGCHQPVSTSLAPAFGIKSADRVQAKTIAQIKNG
jgi:heme/copper-type cytochrome/quinol oxidase subunit 2